MTKHLTTTDLLNLGNGGDHAPQFELGRLYFTPGAGNACDIVLMAAYLQRHRRGDWGCVCADDAALNTAAIKDGNRILSSYPLDPSKPCQGWGENTLWIITEADRSATTFLLPDEY